MALSFRWILAVLFLVSVQADPLEKFILNDFPKALCLDGSTYAAYFRPAPNNSAHATYWAINLQGGGACLSGASCRARALTMLGSSVNYSNTWTDPDNTLSGDASFNPFWDFNHVFLPYCSGDVYTGQQTSVNSYGVTFAGHFNLEAVLLYLIREKNLKKATKVLFTGASAGGIGVFNNADFVQLTLRNANSQAQVYALPDAGFYFPQNVHSYPEWVSGGRIPYNYAFSEVTTRTYNSYVNPNCAAKVQHNETHRCIDASVNYKFIGVPVFVLENMYDSQQLQDELLCPGTPCENKEYLRAYGSWMRATMKEQVLNDPRPHNSLWMPSCLDHIETLCMAHPLELQNRNVSSVVSSWFFDGEQFRIMDDCESEDPCNTMCKVVTCVDHGPNHK